MSDGIILGGKVYELIESNFDCKQCALKDECSSRLRVDNICDLFAGVERCSFRYSPELTEKLMKL